MDHRDPVEVTRGLHGAVTLAEKGTGECTIDVNTGRIVAMDPSPGWHEHANAAKLLFLAEEEASMKACRTTSVRVRPATRNESWECFYTRQGYRREWSWPWQAPSDVFRKNLFDGELH